MTNPIYNQNGFRFYDDDGAHTVLENENDDHSIDADINFMLRVEVEITNAKAVNNVVFTLYAQKNGVGGYNPVTGVTTNGIQIELSGNFADGDSDNNNRLTSSSLTFAGGCLQEVTPFSGPVAGYDFVGTDHWEIEVCLAIDSANANDTDYFDFEIRNSVGGVLNGYTREPRVTYAGAAAPRRIFITHV